MVSQDTAAWIRDVRAERALVSYLSCISIDKNMYKPCAVTGEARFCKAKRVLNHSSNEPNPIRTKAIQPLGLHHAKIHEKRSTVEYKAGDRWVYVACADMILVDIEAVGLVTSSDSKVDDITAYLNLSANGLGLKACIPLKMKASSVFGCSSVTY